MDGGSTLLLSTTALSDDFVSHGDLSVNPRNFRTYCERKFKN